MVRALQTARHRPRIRTGGVRYRRFDPPRILHIITRMDMGGSAQNTLLTCQGLADRYPTVLIHGPTRESRMSDAERRCVRDGIAAFRARGGRVVVIPGLVRRINPLLDAHAFLRLYRLMAAERPAIVHTHTSKAGLLGRWAAWLARVPIVVHTPHGHVFYGHFGSILPRIFLSIERFSDSITDHTVALTKGECDDYRKMRVTTVEKMAIIHSGVDTTPFASPRVSRGAMRKRLAVAPETVLVGTVGWLLPIKGPDILLAAMQGVWAHRSTVCLVYVGKGDMEARLKADARRLGVFDRVRFLGWRSDIPDLMHAMDIFVLPSRNEGMGRVVVEAMAAGRPVVASRTGGIPDLVLDGENGLLVPPGDAAALERAIRKLVDHPTLRWEMGKKGRRAADAFSLRKMVDQLDALYGKLLETA